MGSAHLAQPNRITLSAADHEEIVATISVGLDSDAESSLGRIFGEHNNITISAVERLTQLLPRLYVRMRR